jgi:hypothetical protein
MIARQAGLRVVPWDGYLKYYNLGDKHPALIEKRRKVLADRLRRCGGGGHGGRVVRAWWRPWGCGAGSEGGRGGCRPSCMRLRWWLMAAPAWLCRALRRYLPEQQGQGQQQGLASLAEGQEEGQQQQQQQQQWGTADAKKGQ